MSTPPSQLDPSRRQIQVLLSLYFFSYTFFSSLGLIFITLNFLSTAKIPTKISGNKQATICVSIEKACLIEQSIERTSATSVHAWYGMVYFV